MATTTYYGIELPTNNADEDTWGIKLNDALDGVTVEMFRIEGLIPDGDFAPLASPTFTGTVTAPTFAGNLTGNATTASRWANPINVILSGVITGQNNMTGASNVTITTSIANNALSIAKTSGLQTALNGKEPTLAANRKREINYGTAAAPSNLAEGVIYFQHEA